MFVKNNLCMKTPKMNRRDAVKKVAMGASAAMVLPLNMTKKEKKIIP